VESKTITKDVNEMVGLSIVRVDKKISFLILDLEDSWVLKEVSFYAFKYTFRDPIKEFHKSFNI